MNGVRTASEKQKLMKDIAFWARARGRQAPTSKEGWKVLIAEYFSQRVAQEVVPYETEIPDDEATHLIDDGATIQIADPVPQGVFEDDWNQLLRQRAEAAIGPNGEALDDFDQEFQLLGTTRAELNAVAPFTRSNPPTLLNSVLGSQAIASNAPGSLAVNVANWIGDDAETTPVTVTFYEVQAFQISAPKASGIFRPYGIVKFGTRGVLATAEVDMDQQFTISGSQVTLEVAMEITSGGTTETMLLAGMLSFKPVVRTAPVTRTLYLGSIADAASVTVTVPNFAKSVTVWRGTAAVDTVACTIAFLDTIGLAGTYYIYTLAAGAYNNDPIPIAGNVRQITVTNNNGAGQASTFFCIFNLGI